MAQSSWFEYRFCRYRKKHGGGKSGHLITDTWQGMGIKKGWIKRTVYCKRCGYRYSFNYYKK